jgi:hypothetical protein
VASKSAYRGAEKGAEIEEVLTDLEKLLERVKVLYEQYFMGMAKVAPAHQHVDLERRMRDVTQLNIRNTALRYRFATITQKFGSYNTYWKRTLREIENGRYLRNLSKIKRKAEQYGDDIPAEILAAMPKRMQDQIKRDRELAAKQAERRGMLSDGDASGASDELGGADDFSLDDGLAPEPAPRPARPAPGTAHFLDEDLGDFDVDAMFAAIGADEPPPAAAKPAAPPPAAAKPAAPPPPAARPTAPPPPPPSPPRASGGTAPPRPIMPTAGARPGRPSVPPPPPIPRPSIPAPRVPSAPPTAPAARPAAPPRAATAPPARPETPGMSEADVRTLYAKYVKARELVGAKSDEGTYDKLIRTIQQQAPKIMQQYGAQGVEFGVVIKDKQVILKAKPKP